ncbi:MAG: hypothetical protein AAGI30_09495 [Planctomycetota bacterium]
MPAHRSMLIVAALLCSSAQATLTINNGLDTNTFDAITTETLFITDSTTGDPTSIDIRENAELGESIFNTSLITDLNSSAVVNGATLTSDAIARNNSSITLNEAIVEGGLITANTSTAIVNGATIDRYVEACNDSNIHIIDGSFAGEVQARDSSTMQIMGGEFDDRVEAAERAVLEVFGGTLSTPGSDHQDIGLAARGLSTIYIYGINFQINGLDVDYGEITLTSGVLTGTLSDGTDIETLIARERQRVRGTRYTGTIILVEQPVPTPGGASLLALSASITRRRRC